MVPDDTKHELAADLEHIEEQIRDLRTLVENSGYCDLLLQQIAAVRSALDGVRKRLVAKQLDNCMLAGMLNRNQEEVIRELLSMAGRLMR